MNHIQYTKDTTSMRCSTDQETGPGSDWTSRDSVSSSTEPCSTPNPFRRLPVRVRARGDEEGPKIPSRRARRRRGATWYLRVRGLQAVVGVGGGGGAFISGTVSDPSHGNCFSRATPNDAYSRVWV